MADTSNTWATLNPRNVPAVRVCCSIVSLWLILLLRFVNAGSKDGDSLFALPDESVHFAPRVEAGDARRRWALHRNQELVIPRIIVKLGHRVQPSAENITAAGCIGFGGESCNVVSICWASSRALSVVMGLAFSGLLVLAVVVNQQPHATPGGEGGGSKCKPRGITHLLERSESEAERGRSAAEVCTERSEGRLGRRLARARVAPIRSFWIYGRLIVARKYIELDGTYSDNPARRSHLFTD